MKLSFAAVLGWGMGAPLGGELLAIARVIVVAGGGACPSWRPEAGCLRAAAACGMRTAEGAIKEADTAAIGRKRETSASVCGIWRRNGVERSKYNDA